VQGNVASGAPDSGNPVKVGGVHGLNLPTLAAGQRGDLQLDANGGLYVTIKDQNGTNGVDVSNAGADALDPTSFGGLYALTFGYIFNGTTMDRESKATSTSRIPSAAASTNATSAKAAAGTVYAIEALNTSAAVKYLKLYNKASAPTVGTDTPVRTIALPPNNARTYVTFPSGRYFSTGIAYALTGAAADNDTTALTAGDVVGVNIDYS
jgi:hypothetical protein